MHLRLWLTNVTITFVPLLIDSSCLGRIRLRKGVEYDLNLFPCHQKPFTKSKFKLTEKVLGSLFLNTILFYSFTCYTILFLCIHRNHLATHHTNLHAMLFFFPQNPHVCWSKWLLCWMSFTVCIRCWSVQHIVSCSHVLFWFIVPTLYF